MKQQQVSQVQEDYLDQSQNQKNQLNQNQLLLFLHSQVYLENKNQRKKNKNNLNLQHLGHKTHLNKIYSVRNQQGDPRLEFLHLQDCNQELQNLKKLLSLCSQRRKKKRRNLYLDQQLLILHYLVLSLQVRVNQNQTNLQNLQDYLVQNLKKSKLKSQLIKKVLNKIQPLKKSQQAIYLENKIPSHQNLQHLLENPQTQLLLYLIHQQEENHLKKINRLLLQKGILMKTRKKKKNRFLRQFLNRQLNLKSSKSKLKTQIINQQRKSWMNSKNKLIIRHDRSMTVLTNYEMSSINYTTPQMTFPKSRIHPSKSSKNTKKM